MGEAKRRGTREQRVEQAQMLLEEQERQELLARKLEEQRVREQGKPGWVKGRKRSSQAMSRMMMTTMIGLAISTVGVGKK